MHGQLLLQAGVLALLQGQAQNTLSFAVIPSVTPMSEMLWSIEGYKEMIWGRMF